MHSISRDMSGRGRYGLRGILLVLLFVVSLATAFGQATNEPYQLGPEDVITVSVLRHPEFSGDLLVPPDGTLDIPLVGPTKVSGMTLTQVRELFLTALKKRITDPDVFVLLKTPRMLRIYVEGNVKLPAVLDYKPGWRITECLAAAGGLPDTVQAIDCRVSVLRGKDTILKSIPLNDVLQGESPQNIDVAPGDVVRVNVMESFPIYVVGQVGKPGAYQMRLDQATLMSAIAQASGLLPTAATASITVTHLNGEVRTFDLSRVFLYGDKIATPSLKSGDLVTVPELQARFAISGLVKTPGVFPLQDGKVYRMSDAISLAGGNDTKRARMSMVAVLRNQDGKMKRMVVNYGRFLSKGDVTQNPVLMPGDVIYVPETNSIDWQVIFNGLISSYYIVNAAKIN